MKPGCKANMAASHNHAKPFVFLFILVVLSKICTAAENHGYVLYSGQTMSRYDTLKYGDYTLQFNYDCRLVLSDAGKRIWASNNRPIDQPCKCMFEENGNLVIHRGVIYRGDTEEDGLWDAILYGPPGVLWEAIQYELQRGHYVLILQKDRNLVIYGPVLWETGTSIYQMHPTNLTTNSNNERYILYGGETINPGESLKNGRFSLVMQKDCNLVLYDGEKTLWSTKTAGRNDNCICRLRNDGNLVVYRSSEDQRYWRALNGRSWVDKGNYVLLLQSDGNLVIYDNAVWSTGTHLVKAIMPAINGFASINGST